MTTVNNSAPVPPPSLVLPALASASQTKRQKSKSKKAPSQEPAQEPVVPEMTPVVVASTTRKPKRSSKKEVSRATCEPPVSTEGHQEGRSASQPSPQGLPGRKVNLEKMIQDCQSTCGVSLPITKCSALIVNEILHPEIHGLLLNLEECRVLTEDAPGSPGNATPSEPAVQYAFANLHDTTKTYIREAYVAMQTEQKEAYERRKLKEWEADTSAEGAARLEKALALVQQPDLKATPEYRERVESALLELDAGFYDSFQEVIEVRHSSGMARGVPTSTNTYTSIQGMPDTDKFSFFRRLIRSKRTRMSEVAKTLSAIFTDQVVRGVVFVSVLQSMLARRKMVTVCDITGDMLRNPQAYLDHLQAEFVHLVTSTDAATASSATSVGDAITRIFEPIRMYFPVALSMGTLWKRLAPVHQDTGSASPAEGSAKAEQQPTTEVADSVAEASAADVAEQEQALETGKSRGSSPASAKATKTARPFTGYILKVVESVKLELKDLLPTTPELVLGLSVRASLKQTCSDLATETLTKLGTLMKIDVLSRKTKTINQRSTIAGIQGMVAMASSSGTPTSTSSSVLPLEKWESDLQTRLNDYHAKKKNIGSSEKHDDDQETRQQ